MDALNRLIDDLLSAVANGRASWPDVGVFGLQSRKRMPGFPGFTRVQYWPAEHLYRLLNNGDDPPAVESAPPFPTDPGVAAKAARAIADELVARGEVKVPGFGHFGVEKRKTTGPDWYTVAFRADPVLLRRLNPADASYDAAVAVEWPNGLPTSPPAVDAS
jgi:hypothetical protein